MNEGRGDFSPEQIERLLRPIRPSRVFQSQGHSNVAAWDVTAHLTRMFGFGRWEKEILALDVVSAARGPDIDVNKSGWYVTYRCLMRLRIFDPEGYLVCSIDDVATGTAQNQPHLGDAHDFASKNAVSYALKRCAKDLGDQYGLSLYAKGSEDAVVGMTLVGAPDVRPGTEPEIQVDGEEYEPGEEPFVVDTPPL